MRLAQISFTATRSYAQSQQQVRFSGSNAEGAIFVLSVREAYSIKTANYLSAKKNECMGTRQLMAFRSILNNKFLGKHFIGIQNLQQISACR